MSSKIILLKWSWNKDFLRQKWTEFVTRIPSWQEIVQEVLHREGKWCQLETAINGKSVKEEQMKGFLHPFPWVLGPCPAPSAQPSCPHPCWTIQTRRQWMDCRFQKEWLSQPTAVTSTFKELWNGHSQLSGPQNRRISSKHSGQTCKWKMQMQWKASFPQPCTC